MSRLRNARIPARQRITLDWTIEREPFMSLHAKDGRPLQVSGDTVYSGTGQPVGRIRGDKVYRPDGRYVGTIKSGRLLYRSTDSGGIGAPYSAANRGGSGQGHAGGSGLWGDEPDIPD